MGEIGAPVVGLFAELLDQGGQLLHRRLGQPVAEPNRLRFDAAPAVAAGNRGQERIDLVDDLPEHRILGRARVRQVDRHFRADAAGIAAEDQDAVSHIDRLLDVVRHHQDALGRDPPLHP